MSESTTTDHNEDKRPARFDLSDGLSSEDFIALGNGLLSAIVFVLKIIFFPIVWVKRMLVRLQKFLFNPHAERLLTDDEKLLVSSVPIFLGFLGLTLGAVFALIAYVNNRSKFLAKFSNVTDFFKQIGAWIKGTFDFIGTVWGYIYQNILINSKNAIIDNVFGKNVDKVIPFLALSLIGFIGAIVILVILELQFVRSILSKISRAINYIVYLPVNFYNWLQDAWNNVLEVLGKPVMGGDMLDKYTNKFYQKALRLILLFALIFLFLAFYIFIRNKDLSQFKDTNSYLFLISVMLLAGLFAGYPVAYLFVKLLKSLSKDKYEARSVIPTAVAQTPVATTKSTSSSPASTPSAIPVAKLKGKTAKERAEERRRLHELEKKNK